MEEDENEAITPASSSPPRFDRSLWNRLKSWELRMELLVLLMSFCNTATNVLTPTLAMNKMRRAYPTEIHDPAELKRFLTKWMVRWDQRYNLVAIPLTCLSGVFFGTSLMEVSERRPFAGAYSDNRGRKLPLIAGIVGVLLDNAVRFFVWSETFDLPLEFLFVAAVFAGLFGGFSLFMSAINAYLSDQFEVKKTLSVRMIAVSTLFSVGSLAGAQAAGWGAKLADDLTTFALAQLFIPVSLLYVLFKVENLRPKRPDNGEQVGRAADGEQPSDSQRNSPVRLFVAAIVSLRDSAFVFVRRRERSCRLFLFVCFFANFVDQLVFGEEKSLIGTYTKLPPFDWTTRDYALYKTIYPFAQIGGMLFGLLVLKRALKWRDTGIIALSIVSLSACCLCIGLAQRSWLIYASLAPGSLHGLLIPLTVTFLTCVVDSKEVGKTLAISSIVSRLAALLQTAALQSVFVATVDWCQGFVWFLLSAMSALAACIYFGVHLAAKRLDVGA
ncbi:hypothetical protein M3Y99_01784400 [Aphelenchoides fujianensis]|nr:hypothetical protein M3Y99_01784400 [Aphelenchoides fujianensis]